MRDLIKGIDQDMDRLSKRYRELMAMEAKIQLAYRDLNNRRDALMDERERLTLQKRSA